MKFYTIIPKSNYEDYILSEDNRSYELNQKFDTSDILLTDWGCKEIVACSKGKKGDVGYCSEPCAALVLSTKAYNELKDIFQDGAELLPVKYGKETWYIVHGTKIEEEINFAERGRVVTYKIFKNGPKEIELGNKYFFRLNDRYGEMIFTEKFISLLDNLNYKGISFKETGEINES